MCAKSNEAQSAKYLKHFLVGFEHQQHSANTHNKQQQQQQQQRQKTPRSDPHFQGGRGAWLVASIYLRHARECKQIKLQIMISCLTARTLITPPPPSSPVASVHPKLDKTRATKMSHTN